MSLSAKRYNIRAIETANAISCPKPIHLMTKVTNVLG